MNDVPELTGSVDVDEDAAVVEGRAASLGTGVGRDGGGGGAGATSSVLGRFFSGASGAGAAGHQNCRIDGPARTSFGAPGNARWIGV